MDYKAETMEKIKEKKIDTIILQVFLFLLSLVTIFILKDFIGGRYVGNINFVLFPLVAIFMLARRYKLLIIEKTYIYSLCIGFILHVLVGADDFSRIGNSLFARIVPILLLSLAMQQKTNPKIFIAFFVLFFVSECGLSIYEKLTMNHYYKYDSVDDFMATTASMDDTATFRSYALMLHPLFNANTVSVCLAFILCAKHIKGSIKYSFIVLGLLALWGFNSRGAMIIWSIILFYRIAMYKAKPVYIVTILIVLYFILPPLIEWILYSGILGRLADFDFSDSSTLTRFEAYDTFFSEKWNFYDIIAGGREICYPGTQFILENGFLVDLGYWGIIIGSVKILGELLITYKAISKYSIKDKILIMLSIWGVAFMNNNSYQTWLMPIFVMACVSFNSFMPYRNKDN